MDKKSQEYKFSIIVPCYNEEDAVEQTVKDIVNTLDKWKKENEVNLFFEMILSTFKKMPSCFCFSFSRQGLIPTHLGRSLEGTFRKVHNRNLSTKMGIQTLKRSP